MSWHKDPEPHRTFRRGMEGEDVRRFQVALQIRLGRNPEHLRHKGVPRTLRATGRFDDPTFAAWREVRYSIGFTDKQTPTKGAQKNIIHPDTRTAAARARAEQRRKPPQVTRPREAFVSNVPNQSDRSEAIRLIVLHDTEGGNVPGAADLHGVDSWFRNPGSEASAHVTVDAEGNASQHVPDDRKAWACASYNSRSLNIEQIGFMTQRAWPDAQLRVVAQYVAFWSQKYGIPLKHSTSHGVCQHKELGVAGGNHDDCGSFYPFDRVLQMARDLI